MAAAETKAKVAADAKAAVQAMAVADIKAAAYAMICKEESSNTRAGAVAGGLPRPSEHLRSANYARFSAQAWRGGARISGN